MLRKTLKLSKFFNIQKKIGLNSFRSYSTQEYSDELMDHLNHPRNVGSLDKEGENVGTGVAGSPACGDVMQFQIELDENDVVVDAKFKTFGCGSAIASSSYATELVKGKTIDEILEVKNSDISNYLALPPVKVHCSVLAEQAIKKAVLEIREKKKRMAEMRKKDEEFLSNMRNKKK